MSFPLSWEESFLHILLCRCLREKRFFFVNSTVKTIIFWVFIFACLVVLWQVFQKSAGTGKDQEIAWSDFLQDAQQGQVSDVTVTDREVRGHLRADKGAFHVTVPANYPHLFDVLDQN